jgi:hypothetical protein
MASNSRDLLPPQQLIADVDRVARDLVSGDKIHIHVIVNKHHHIPINVNVIKSSLI